MMVKVHRYLDTRCQMLMRIGYFSNASYVDIDNEGIYKKAAVNTLLK